MYLQLGAVDELERGAGLGHLSDELLEGMVVHY